MFREFSSEYETVLKIADPQPIVLTAEQLLTAEAMQLLMRVDAEIREARAQWNHDWFRRLMRVRRKAVSYSEGDGRNSIRCPQFPSVV